MTLVYSLKKEPKRKLILGMVQQIDARGTHIHITPKHSNPFKLKKSDIHELELRYSELK